ncbi:hypothetical protein GRAN_1658 [Granulicella sibirica]|uniref:Uncharacterized protein n=1 Tax=Granulicella sibirica TaxID=2479048 RepID=A0A4Q0T876_9BACT|nr:hypothetical protein GRAN_1658 [Granulicella sibirica]
MDHLYFHVQGHPNNCTIPVSQPNIVNPRSSRGIKQGHGHSHSNS